MSSIDKSLLQSEQNPVVSVIMGSISDMDVLQYTVSTLRKLSIPCEVKVVSAHRTPKRLYEFAENANIRGIKTIIAGAGGAAHLPGMAASISDLPVIGVPVKSKTLNGVDSLLSIVQMPAGIPVATMAIGKAGAVNAALFAAAMLANEDVDVQKKLKNYREKQTEKVNINPTEY